MEERLVIPLSGYHPVIAAALWCMEDTRQRTKKAVAGLSMHALVWSTPEMPNSISTLLYHIAAIETSYLYTDILEVGWSAELEPILPYDVRSSHCVLIQVRGETIEQHLQRLDSSRQLLLNAFHHLTLEEYRRPRRVEDYITTPEWVLHHLMQHEAEHRGQIGEIRAQAELNGTQSLASDDKG
jgi:uncharacterized damage-inducible protein DinB